MGEGEFGAVAGFEHLDGAAWAASTAMAAADDAQDAILHRLGNIEAQLSALGRGGAPCRSTKESLLGELVVALGDALVAANTRLKISCNEVKRLQRTIREVADAVALPPHAPGSAPPL